MPYLVKRIAEAIPLFFIMIAVAFILVHAAPGDPAYILAGESGTTPEYVEMIRTKWGLDKPLWEQFAIYMSRVIKGDLGYSLVFNQPVLRLILERIPATLLLCTTSLLWALAAGTTLGILSSRNPYSAIDNLSTSVSLIGYSLPSFWLGIMLIMVFSVYLGLFPTSGMYSVRFTTSGLAAVGDVLYHLVLPSVTLGFWYLALITRLTRAGMLEALGQDYVLTARAKGATGRTVLYRHALPNALLPLTTYVALSIGQLLGGAVVTETVFGWPGMGRLLYDSLVSLDYPVVVGILIVTSSLMIIANILADVVYSFIDPRIKYR
jgi:peptide/nickel transport system permease protein